MAWQGVTSDTELFVQSRRSARADVPKGRGTVGRAARGRQPASCNDLAAEQEVGAARAEMLECGYRSVISLPLVVNDRVTAVLVLYAKEPEFFDELELRLLTELAGDISFALQYIEKMEQADFLAYYDPLTGLANRTLFHERLGQSLKSAEAKHKRLAVLMLNLDRFRHVNDTLGRQAGDTLIRQIAERLNSCVLDSGHLAHIGADQFAIAILYQRADEIALLIKGSIHDALGEPFRLNGSDLRVSVKHGIALCPDDGTDAETLLRNAEAALKKAKSSGDHYLFFAPRMTAKVSEKLALENGLWRALENDEFVLHYQPKLELATGHVSGLEALIRWQHPERGLVPPMQFIPLLEETGLILEAGKWVLEQAAADYRAWREQRLEPPRIAVNVSAIQIQQRDFVEHVENAIRLTGMEAALDLEITESAIMENLEDQLDKLLAAKAAGLNIVIDDFGTGYSSLRYLAQLPVSALKIDRSFVAGMTARVHNQLIVSSIITLAHGLNLKVVAEGVDEKGQLELLKQLHCDDAQGYFFSRPLPASDVVRMLENPHAVRHWEFPGSN